MAEVEPDVLLDVARHAATVWRTACGRTSQALIERDGAIRAAMRAGLTAAQVADATGLSRERIYQIRDGRR